MNGHYGKAEVPKMRAKGAVREAQQQLSRHEPITLITFPPTVAKAVDEVSTTVTVVTDGASYDVNIRSEVATCIGASARYLRQESEERRVNH
jgi:hypothetical protein